MSRAKTTENINFPDRDGSPQRPTIIQLTEEKKIHTQQHYPSDRDKKKKEQQQQLNPPPEQRIPATFVRKKCSHDRPKSMSDARGTLGLWRSSYPTRAAAPFSAPPTRDVSLFLTPPLIIASNYVASLRGRVSSPRARASSLFRGTRACVPGLRLLVRVARARAARGVNGREWEC